MKNKLDKVLLEKRGRIVVRTAVWITIIVLGGITWRIVDSAAAIGKKNEAFGAYLALIDSVGRLESLASDSLLRESARLSEEGVLIGWEGAAQWLDTIQSYGRDDGIAMEYRIDSLMHPSETFERLYLMPLDLFLTSKIGKFETVLRLLEKICGEPAASVLFTRIDMLQDNQEYIKTSAVMYRWIKL